ncbi:ribosome maturation factor RimP [Promicromonospora thailandica]|uniref:Ribosome maturation factor RimP n=1 Tax=Promicromonospora thailandica TaxID=765201 RepID=A0A9X2JV95_9MICO|nr:ribosome maturation factor RimP [Promicromonospora thailandica]MCP2263853.1 ribosome maturation factor RimP [Promicromonospora thailandica]BFF17844.1 hypothetical protein GCM10025730_13650 [Promicromonospora thailandica]
MTQQAEAVRDVVRPAVEAAGLYLEEVTATRAGSRSVVRVTVDLPEDAVGSLDSDQLGEVSRAVSAALDEDDVVPGAYTLEISTPGTSRPLTELRHFKRARTRLVTLKLADGARAEGRLTDVLTDGDAPVLVLDDDRRIDVADVVRGKVEVELKRLEEAQDAEAGELGESAGEGTDDDADGAGFDDATAGRPGRNEEG